MPKIQVMIVQSISLALLAMAINSTLVAPPAWANAFEPPPDSDAPRSTAGGGSRPAPESSCTLDEASGLRATVLAPQSFVGLTDRATPRLWLYVPTNEAKSIEISLFDQQLNGLTQFEIVGPNTTGVLGIDLSEPSTLTVGAAYYWTAAFICTPERRTEDWVTGGWIKYQPIAPPQPWQTLPPIDQVKQSMGTGYWYDAFTKILPLIQAEPASSDVEALWDGLMQQADLELTWIDVENVIRISKP